MPVSLIAARRANSGASGPWRGVAGRVAPIAVVDVGSNSVRLVVFDGPKRVPVPMFNEKVLCGLGRGMNGSRTLHPQGVELALETLERFAGMARAMGVTSFHLLATAAVRDASNGPAFVEEIKRRCAGEITVLSGAEEARLAAQGVVAGLPDADGLMGDLGGSSLELVGLDHGRLEEGLTLPLGPLRLIDAAGGDREKAEEIIAGALEQVPWLGSAAGRTYYPVGGAWRALARIHMEQSRYPLHMVHGYAIPLAEAEELAELVSRLGKRSLARIAGVPQRRLDTLPYAALLLKQLLAAARPQRLVFSAYGLREGWVFDRLPAEEQALDPLEAAAREWGAQDGRFGDIGDAVADWIAPLFAGESAPARRLRIAACLLADIGWRYHPDYRSEHAMLRILRAQELCVEHHERAFIAYALYTRYGGKPGGAATATVDALLRPKKAKRAIALGAALRLAYALSVGSTEMLACTRLSVADGVLTLAIPAQAAVPPGKTIEKRLGAVARALGLADSRLVN